MPINSTIKVTTPQVKNIDREYIKDISERAMLDVVNGSYDSAITKSRTLLEEVFCYVELGTRIVSKSIAKQVDDVFTQLLFKKVFVEV